MSIVFDSSALLAITFEEEGADIAAQALNDGIISAVNASEVITRYIDLGASEDDARASLLAFGLNIYPLLCNKLGGKPDSKHSTPSPS